MDLNKLKVIAKAKFSDKSNLGSWYKDRLEICSQCPMNSKNKTDLTLKERAMVSLNLGQPTCLACGCEIAAKTSVRSEQCGLVKKGLQPLWPALPEIQELGFRDFRIENLSADKVTLDLKQGLVINYRDLKYKEDSKIFLNFEDLTRRVTSLTLKAGCGCTVANLQQKDNNFLIDIEYNTNRIGDFEKTIVMSIVMDYTVKSSYLFKIKGTVKNKYGL